jgi:hypothetical protein
MEEVPAGESISPDQTLAQLYKSARPPVELVPGVSLSPIVNGAWLPKEAKVGEGLYRRADTLQELMPWTSSDVHVWFVKVGKHSREPTCLVLVLSGNAG